MKKWQIGDRVAYFEELKWIVTTVIRVTKTQGILKNGRRFRLEDGYLLNAPVPTCIKLEETVFNQIETWKKEQEQEENLLKEKARLRDLIAHIQVGYYSQLNLEDIKAIADCIEKRLN